MTCMAHHWQEDTWLSWAEKSQNSEVKIALTDENLMWCLKHSPSSNCLGDEVHVQSSAVIEEHVPLSLWLLPMEDVPAVIRLTLPRRAGIQEKND